MGRAAALAAALVVAACGGPAALAPPPPAPALWSVRDARFVDRAVLVEALRSARFRFIGEIHDNAAQHGLRADLVSALANEHPAAVMEIFDFGHDGEIASAQARGANADEIATAGALDREAWSWPLHRPLVAAANDAGMPIRAANVPRGELMALAKGTASTPPADRWKARLAATPWGEREQRALADGIVDSHCGMLPSEAVPAIALAQRIRDAAMAEALANAARESGGAILLAGDGHARRDIGAPRYLLPAELPKGEGDMVSVAFIEATAAEMRTRGFARQSVADNPGFDYLWFTLPAARPDPCAGLESRFGRRPKPP